VSHDDPAFAFLQSFPGTINAGFTGGEGLAVIGTRRRSGLAA